MPERRARVLNRLPVEKVRRKVRSSAAGSRRRRWEQLLGSFLGMGLSCVEGRGLIDG